MTTRNSSAWMWHDACLILDRAERMQREFFRLGVERRPVPTWQPPVDILESDSELMIIVALPGVKSRDLDVRVDGDTLIIAAVRSLPATDASVIRRLEDSARPFREEHRPRRWGAATRPARIRRRLSEAAVPQDRLILPLPGPLP